MELDRKKNVINMMITSHSILRDKYTRLNSLFENSLLFSSVILNAFVFIDPNFLASQISINEEKIKLIIGLSSILVFSITVVLIQVNWKSKIKEHSKASSTLFKLLQEIREINEMQNIIEKEEKKMLFNETYSTAMSSIEPIPDKLFNKLKSRHYNKLELSKLIDKNPGTPFYILKIKLLLSTFK